MKTSLDFLNKTEKKVVLSFANELIKKLGDEIITIKLFGSKVRGDFNKNSDIDIFILVKEKTQKLRDVIAEVEDDHNPEYSLPISVVLNSLFEYEKNKKLNSFFIESLDKEGIILKDTNLLFSSTGHNTLPHKKTKNKYIYSSTKKPIMMKELALYRMQKAKDCLVQSKEIFNLSHYGLSANRSYYAMFTAARSLLCLKRKDSSKHSGVIALFNQYIINLGLFPKELSKYLPEAKKMREDADYEDFVEIRKVDAELQFKRATKFLEEAEKTMKKMIKQAANKGYKGNRGNKGNKVK